jgi:hypothetical protein
MMRIPYWAFDPAELRDLEHPNGKYVSGIYNDDSEFS